MTFMTPTILDCIRQCKSDDDVAKEDPDSLQILTSKEDHVFLWSRKHQHILAIHKGKSATTVQTLTLTDTPIFEVERLDVSSTGRWLSLSGQRGVTAVELPRRYGKDGRFGGNSSEVVCRTVPIAERFFLCQKRLVVQQVGWHPASLNESHLVVLSSDNYLRIYNLDTGGNETPERSLTIRPNPLFAESNFSVKSSLGENAMGFSFSPPIPDENDPNLIREWPIFVILGDGSIYCLIADLNPNIPSRVLGPIPTKFETEVIREFCSILCLHPMISSPPVLVLGTTGGTLYHCVVLRNEDYNDDDDDDRKSQMSAQWSTSLIDNDVTFSLFVFESVELELGLSTHETSKRPFNYPINLYPDPTTPSRYFCFHGAGVHCVGVPMIFDLVKMALRDDNADEDAGDFHEDCTVEHLICTRMGTNCPPAPVLGLTVIPDQRLLLCLLYNYRMECLPLSLVPEIVPLPLTFQESPLTTTKRLNKDPFDSVMKQLLQRSTSHPLIKSAKETNLEPKECLEILTRSTQVLKEEYINKMEAVRYEIERKVAGLTKQKSLQITALSKLDHDRKILRDNAGQLAERYEDIKDNGDRLNSRIEIVLQLIQRRLPVCSDAELGMKRDLHEIEKKVKDLKSSLDQVKAKEKYQTRKMKQSPLTDNGGNRRIESNYGMKDCQIESIKAILEIDSNLMSDMVKQINSAKKDLCM